MDPSPDEHQQKQSSPSTFPVAGLFNQLGQPSDSVAIDPSTGRDSNPVNNQGQILSGEQHIERVHVAPVLTEKAPEEAAQPPSLPQTVLPATKITLSDGPSCVVGGACQVGRTCEVGGACELGRAITASIANDDSTAALIPLPLAESPPTKKQLPSGSEDDVEVGGPNTGGKAVGLKPKIGLFGGINIIVGCIIGSGIFISPKGVHENILSVGWALVIWVICGLFSAVGAYCYAELGTFIRESGGDYAYVLAAFGPVFGFLRMWIECIIVRPCTITAVAITFATYILQPLFPHCGLPFLAPQFIAAIVILLICMVNCLSVGITSRLQDVFSVGKMFSMGLIILTGLYLIVVVGDPHLNSFKSAFTVPVSLSAGQVALAFYSGLWAYNGWNYLNYITEEMINPIRDLPRAIFISSILCTIFYLLVNVAFYAGSVSPNELVESSAIAITFANRFYGPFAFIMPILVAASCFGTVNGIMLTSSRLFFSAARNEHMPTVLCYINPYVHTPIPSVILTAVLSLSYLLLSDNIYTLINYVQIVNWIAIGLATAGLLYLRVKRPPRLHPRPLQVHIIFPVVFLAGCVFLVIFPVIQAPLDTAIGIGIMLSGLPVYFLFIHSRHVKSQTWEPVPTLVPEKKSVPLILGDEDSGKKSTSDGNAILEGDDETTEENRLPGGRRLPLDSFMDKATLLLQKLFLVVPVDKKSA